MIILNIQQQILIKILMIPAILIAFTFHEYAHAKLADRLGDKTPKFQGRLTLNPFAHIDLIGFIMILLVGFGWAKPVEIDGRSFKNYYKDDLKVSLAGPVANLIVAFLTAILMGLYLKLLYSAQIPTTVASVIFSILDLTISINCMLFLFNLLPLPGLDGFHILRDLFPKFFYNISDKLYRYQIIILIIIIFPIGNTSIAGIIIGKPSGAIYSLFKSIAFMIGQ